MPSPEHPGVGIVQHFVPSRWLLSLSDVHLGFHGLTAPRPLMPSNILLSIPLLEDTLLACEGSFQQIPTSGLLQSGQL